MPKRMLIDATHPEETRVVVINGTRLEEFDFESSTKRQVKGNIYLAKVTRVEPSLQAAFIEYGGNRHGFLAFSEIHPDYYRIPVSDRPHGATGLPEGYGQDDRADDIGAGNGEDSGVPLSTALPEPVEVPQSESEDDPGCDESEGGPPEETLSAPDVDFGEDAGEMAAASRDDAPADRQEEAGGGETEAAEREPAAVPATMAPHAAAEPVVAAEIPAADAAAPYGESGRRHDEPETGETGAEAETVERGPASIALRAAAEPVVMAEISAEDIAATGGDDGYRDESAREVFTGSPDTDAGPETASSPFEPSGIAPPDAAPAAIENGDGDEADVTQDSIETLGGDEFEEVEEADAAERRRRHPMRHYKIQEVIKRRQIMLVQVAKEERGSKGAALTTYLSLAGRYCVLMPNTNRGGGVSRKITSLTDRRRLKDILEELDIPEGMGVIVRTAGAERSKAEIKRDYEYLLRLWNEIRDLTLRSTAPALIYEEGNLIKRSIRDLYTRDIDEVLVEGEEGYRTAKAFMRTLMPSHAKRVQPYRDPQIGLFHRFQVESQIDAIHSPVAQLRSGGYLVINQTEALVAIDVNSGRSTRERNIEETAVRTNIEAAEEIARQLRLRDLAGLIVIDFIDMEEHRNQIAVERRLKEALKNDRARIQVGRISPFGLLEMSRQRLRPSLTETSTQPCPHCGGTGFVRSVESTALHVLRSIEEEGIRRRSAEICIYVPTTVALYILNQKRDSLNRIESRYTLRVMVARDDSLIPPAFRLERLRPYEIGEAPPLRPIQAPSLPEHEDDEADESEAAESEPDAVAAEAEAASETDDAGRDHLTEEERGRRRRRRRRRRDEPRHAATRSEADDEPEDAEMDRAAGGESAEAASAMAARGGDSEAERRRRRRGRRGGRLRPQRDERHEEAAASDANAETTAEAPTEINAEAGGPAVETIEIVPVEAALAVAESETITLDPWSSEYGLEAASLAPFAGEPPAGAAEQPGPGGEIAREAWRSPEHEMPGGGSTEPGTMPVAEVEEGVPFVSIAERAFEVTAAAERETPPWEEPARAAPEPAAPETAPEAASGDLAGGEVVPAAPVAADRVDRDLIVTDDARAEPATPEPLRDEPAAPEPIRDESAVPEPAYAEAAPSDLVTAEASPPPASRSAEDLLVVTEKPANPRRGWWQRAAPRP